MSENTILVCLAGYAFLVVLFIAEGLYNASGWLWKRWKGILGVGMVLFLAGSAKADPLPNLIDIAVNVSWNVPVSHLVTITEGFQASYEVQNIGAQPVFILGNPSGGNYVLVPGSLSFATTGPLGPFTLVCDSCPPFWRDPLGNEIQIFREAIPDYWKIPGHYDGLGVELFTVPPSSPGALLSFGTGTVDVTVPTPEPATLVMLGCSVLYFVVLILHNRRRDRLSRP